MGHYYVIACPELREFIDPRQFGDNIKLIDMMTSHTGSLAALALLLAAGNGAGDGDIMTRQYRKDFEALGRTGDPGFMAGYHEGHKPRGPEIAGRWAGKGIILAGSQVGKGTFGAPQDKTLWEHARETFTNISEDVLLAMTESEVLSSHMAHKERRPVRPESQITAGRLGEARAAGRIEGEMYLVETYTGKEA